MSVVVEEISRVKGGNQVREMVKFPSVRLTEVIAAKRPNKN